MEWDSPVFMRVSPLPTSPSTKRIQAASGHKFGHNCRGLTLPSESVSHNWLYFVVVVAVDKWEAAVCFPLIHSLFLFLARRQLAIAAVLRFQSCSNCIGLT